MRLPNIQHHKSHIIAVLGIELFQGGNGASRHGAGHRTGHQKQRTVTNEVPGGDAVPVGRRQVELGERLAWSLGGLVEPPVVEEQLGREVLVAVIGSHLAPSLDYANDTRGEFIGWRTAPTSTWSRGVRLRGGQTATLEG